MTDKLANDDLHQTDAEADIRGELEAARARVAELQIKTAELEIKAARTTELEAEVKLFKAAEAEDLTKKATFLQSSKLQAAPGSWKPPSASENEEPNLSPTTANFINARAKAGRLFFPLVLDFLKAYGSVGEVSKEMKLACANLIHAAQSLKGSWGANLKKQKFGNNGTGMFQERSISGFISLALEDIFLDVQMIHQCCLGKGGTHADGLGLKREANVKPYARQVCLLLECKETEVMTAESRLKPLFQLCNEWHRATTIHRSGAIVGMLADEDGVHAYLMLETSSYLRQVLERVTCVLVGETDVSTIEDCIRQSRDDAGFRTGISIPLASASWSSHVEVERLMQALVRLVSLVPAAPPFEEPAEQDAVSVAQSAIAEADEANDGDNSSACSSPPRLTINADRQESPSNPNESVGDSAAASADDDAAESDEARTSSLTALVKTTADTQHYPRLPAKVYETVCNTAMGGLQYKTRSSMQLRLFPRLVNVLSNTLSVWQAEPSTAGAQTAPLFVVKAFDHSEHRRPPPPDLLNALRSHADMVEVKTFYDSWHITKLADQVSVLTYALLGEKKTVTLQDILNFMKLYQHAFKDWVHGDILRRNVIFPCLLDLDFARKVRSLKPGEEPPCYPKHLNLDKTLHRHPELMQADDVSVVPMRKAHDLYSLGHVFKEMNDLQAQDRKLVAALGEWLAHYALDPNLFGRSEDWLPPADWSAFDKYQNDDWADQLLSEAIETFERIVGSRASASRPTSAGQRPIQPSVSTGSPERAQ
eukprot:TRINITY_DN12412_c0_g1_i1.p1 TRINITY_DN12412_c0_g1~~TRINITY_DN12412_c0_g1_i1.p1  ORF type:complete len:766 (+),score=143.25 TRINITY_DN12412_c0_g1_i1:2-2299(+)